MNELSVIIPALNAADRLPATLAALRGKAGQIVVVDGGSADDTAAVAACGGAMVVRAARGRGHQIAAGIAASAGDWLLLLHADTRLAAGWDAAADCMMHDHPGCAGYFRFTLDSAHAKARRLERLVAWRCRVLGLPYGDQGLLISRALLARIGGVRAMPLMEDVDVVRRIGRHRLIPLDVAAITSSTKWERDGWTARSARNLACLGLYFLGLPPRWLARLY